MKAGALVVKLPREKKLASVVRYLRLLSGDDVKRLRRPASVAVPATSNEKLEELESSPQNLRLKSPS
ncbi:hypothetical protein OK016_20185 [Vibrio chagasii]|nr:hypothetical protein [Vibrio chagasii]